MARTPVLASTADFGMGWYRPEDWDRLLRVITARNKLHDTYAEWLASAEQGERDLLARGQPVRRVMVDPDELATWFLIRSRAPDAAAQAEFVADKMQLAAQR